MPVGDSLLPNYPLVPVDHQPDFDNYSLVPVDHDPFAADGPAQQAQILLAQAKVPPQGAPQQPPATGAGQPDAGAPAAGDILKDENDMVDSYVYKTAQLLRGLLTSSALLPTKAMRHGICRQGPQREHSTG